MIDQLIIFFLQYFYVFIVLLFAAKVILYLRHRNKTWTIAQFFYFNPMNIKFTSNNKRAKLKRLQNLLSLAIVAAVIMQLLIIALV